MSRGGGNGSESLVSGNEVDGERRRRKLLQKITLNWENFKLRSFWEIPRGVQLWYFWKIIEIWESSKIWQKFLKIEWNYFFFKLKGQIKFKFSEKFNGQNKFKFIFDLLLNFSQKFLSL